MPASIKVRRSIAAASTVSQPPRQRFSSTFDMRRVRKQAKLACGRRLDGGVRRLPHQGLLGRPAASTPKTAMNAFSPVLGHEKAEALHGPVVSDAVQ